MRLTESEKRVRIEATLGGTELAAVGLSYMSSLRSFRFISVQKRYFRFKLPTFDPRQPVMKGVDLAHNREQALCAETYLRAGVTGMMVRETVMDGRRATVRRQANRALKAMGRSAPNKSTVRRALEQPVPSVPALGPNGCIRSSFQCHER